MTTERLGGMLIFCVVFLGLFIALIATIPSEFFIASTTYAQYDVPSYFSQEDIQYIKYFINQTVTWSYPYKDNWFDFNPKGSAFKFIVRFGQDPILGRVMIFYHVTWEWWIYYSVDFMDICVGNQKYDLMLKWLLVANYNPELNATIFYPVRCDHISVKVWLGDTNSSRNDVGAAWDEGSLAVGIGYGFDDYETKLGAWDIVGRLLTFQAPEIFGLTGVVATILNLLITLPFYTCVAYLIYRLILMAIPFVSGG